MPIYEYHCLACGGDFEKLVYGQTPGTAIACPACASRDVSRMLSRFGRGGDRGDVMKSAGALAGSTGGGCACASGGGCGCR